MLVKLPFASPRRRPQSPTSTSRRPRVESLERRELMAADFLDVSLVDASRDSTPGTVFQDGALRLDYQVKLTQRESLTSLALVVDKGRASFTLPASGLTTPLHGLPTSGQDLLFDLKDAPELPAGNYQFRIAATTSAGSVTHSEAIAVRVLDTLQVDGSFAGEWFDLQPLVASGKQGIVIHAQGGTDTLALNQAWSQVATINGQAPSQFDARAIGDLPIHQGYAVDHVVLNDGTEVYFTGIERLNGVPTNTLKATSIELSVRPNDPAFVEQWNLHVTDVPSAWRFTTGSEQVLLVSLDTGVLPGGDVVPRYGSMSDLTTDRLILDADDADDLDEFDATYGHGHKAISVMSSTANNATWIAGINWTSDVYVANVYDASANLQTEIAKALDYAAARQQRVVFQGGLQGEYWLTDGGTQQDLENLLFGSRDRAVFAVAAGNGDQLIEETPGPNDDDKLSGGVARLQSEHLNVMAIGALQSTTTVVHGLANASDVLRADYSNYGDALTLMGPTDSPATHFGSDGLATANPTLDEGYALFGGTSAANPHVAGVASLVWSMHVGLSGVDIRSILTDTAMGNLPHGDGENLLTGKDFQYGHGLVNADLAVRRAAALAIDEALVRIDRHPLADLTHTAPNFSTGKWASLPLNGWPQQGLSGSTYANARTANSAAQPTTTSDATIRQQFAAQTIFQQTASQAARQQSGRPASRVAWSGATTVPQPAFSQAADVAFAALAGAWEV